MLGPEVLDASQMWVKDCASEETREASVPGSTLSFCSLSGSTQNIASDVQWCFFFEKAVRAALGRQGGAINDSKGLCSVIAQTWDPLDYAVSAIYRIQLSGCSM